jgi:hypothetical protein
LLGIRIDVRRKVVLDVANGYVHNFTFNVLLAMTGYFNKVNFIGEGGFGKVYKGKINGQVSSTNLFFILSMIKDLIFVSYCSFVDCRWWQC